MSKQTRLFKL